MSHASIRAVLFDLDNTLTHREQSIEAFARYFYRRYSRMLKSVSPMQIESLLKETDNGGYGRPENPYPSIKQSIAKRLRTELAWHLPPSEEELLACWQQQFPKHTIAAPGALAIIELLKHRGYVIGVVSNGIETSRRATLDALQLTDIVDFLLSSETAGQKKPAAEVFVQAAQMAGVSAEQCLFVGDHPELDALGAAAAGMMAVWLRGFHSWPGTIPADIQVVSSLSEIIGLLQSPSSLAYGNRALESNLS